MKLILASGAIAKARRFLSSSTSVQDEEVKDPSKLAEVIRKALVRVSDLEARLAAEALEFECNVGDSGTVTTLAHGFKGPVRWWVTSWLQQSGVTYPVLAPALVQDSSTVTGRLALRSYVTGRAVIRIEPAQADLDPGIAVAPIPPAPIVPDITEYNLVLSGNATTTSTGATNTTLSFAALAGEEWDVRVAGTAMCSATNGMNYEIVAPITATVDGVCWTSSANQAAANLLKLGFSAPNTLIGVCHAGASAALRNDELFFRVKMGAGGGNITLAIASVLSGSTTTLGAQTSMIAKRVTQV